MSELQYRVKYTATWREEDDNPPRQETRVIPITYPSLERAEGTRQYLLSDPYGHETIVDAWLEYQEITPWKKLE